MEQKIVKIGGAELAAKLYGAFDANMKLVEAAFAVTVHNRPDVSGSGEVLTVSGSNSECVDAAARAIETLARMGERSETLAEQTVLYVINMVRDGREGELEAFDENCICVTAKGKPIKPKTVSRNISSRSRATPSSSARDLRVRVRPFLPSRWLSKLCATKRSAESF